MAKLSDEEIATLKKLQEKQKAPDAPSPSVNYTLDLASDAAWERAKQLGIVSEPNGSDDDDDSDEDADDAPRRRSYFPEGK